MDNIQYMPHKGNAIRHHAIMIEGEVDTMEDTMRWAGQLPEWEKWRAKMLELTGMIRDYADTLEDE